MKRIIMASAIMLSFVPMLSIAGSYFPGYVSVYNSGNSVSGFYNVRYTSGSIGLLKMSIGVSNIAVTGQDSFNGTNFQCYVWPTDSLYPLAEKIALAVTNGSGLAVSKSGSTCTSITYSTGSNSLD